MGQVVCLNKEREARRRDAAAEAEDMAQIASTCLGARDDILAALVGLAPIAREIDGISHLVAALDEAAATLAAIADVADDNLIRSISGR